MRSILVTGVSQGLGAALFDEFVDAGHRVLAIGRRFTAGQQATARAQPERIRLRRTDLASTVSLPSAAEVAAFVAGAAQVALVHNAAVIEPLGAIGTLHVEHVIRAVMVNFIAPMLLTNTLLAAMFGQRPAPPAAHPASPASPTAPSLPEQQATVLFISSGAAHRVSGGRAVYSATKRAGEMFFETLAAEYHDDQRVRVALVDPGIMDTNMQTQIRHHTLDGGYLPGGERYLRLAEQGMLPSPTEVARKIAFEHLR